MRISVVTPRFNTSGVPLAQLRFAKALAARGHEVTLLVGWVNEGSALPTAPGVEVRVLGKSRVMGMLGPLTRHLRQARPDVVFTAEDHLTAITLIAASLARSRAKISGSSRVTPFDTYRGPPLSKGWILKRLMRRLMPRADVLTCVSQDMVAQYRTVFPDARHVCVYNIVADHEAELRMQEPVDEPWLDGDAPVLVAAGSLVPWKGFSDLLLAVRDVLRRRPVRLITLGDGPLRADLERQARDLGIADAVKFTGFVANPLKYFARADVFVLSSHVEGMPNVLVEAMMSGCTPVSTNCPTGPRELLQDGKYGYLVPMKDPVALAAGIEKALDHKIPKALLQEAVRPFSAEAVIERHFDLLGIPASERRVTGPRRRATTPDL